MLQHLVLTALGSYTPQLAEQFSKALTDSGCSITDSRMTMLGNNFAMITMLAGNWDSIAKLEDMLPKLEERLDIAIHSKRTELFKPSTGLMPYAIDAVCSNRVSVVYELAKFFASNNIQIQEIYTSSYRASHTGSPMYSVHITVHIPTENSIASLRGDFMEFCDQLNLDAIMEPVK